MIKLWKKPLLKFFSLQYKILIFSLILIITPLFTVGIISYLKSSEIIEKKVSITNLNTVQQIGRNLEFILQDVHDTSLFLFQDKQIRCFFQLSPKLPAIYLQKQKLATEESLIYLLSSKKYIHSIYIRGFNGLTIETKHALYDIDPGIEHQVIELRGRYLWVSNRIIDYNRSVINALTLFRVMNDLEFIDRRLAIIQININEAEIAKIYENKTISKAGYFFIMDQYNKVISPLSKDILNQPIQPGLIDNKLLNKKEGFYEIKSGHQGFLVTFYKIDDVGWTLINIMPLKELLKENSVIQKVNLLVIVISFLACIAIALLFSSKVLSPLKQLRTLMKKVENENFDVSIEIKSNDEIALLGRSFNKMSARLKELLNQVYISQIKQREAELKALQAQVNPHFLYNTLDTIYWSSRLEKAPETSKLVEALSKLFRLSLNSGDELTTVGKEVEHLKNYLTIQQKRYQGMIDFAIKISTNEILDCKVVKLVLQPLVENAIYHGIEKKGQPGKIDIEIYRQNNQLIYRISDDGNGADEDELNGLLSQKAGDNNRGFGIQNVNDRIKLYFGAEFGIRFYSQPSQGTKVIVTQPYTKGETSHAASDDCR